MLKKVLARRKGQKESAAPAAAASKPRAVGGLPFGSLGLLLGLLAALVVAVCALLVWQDRSAQQGRAAQQLAQVRAEAMAARLQGHVATLGAVADRLSESPELRAAAAGRDAAAVAAATGPAGALIPGLLGARLVYPDQVETDYSQRPVLGYAALDLARRVEKGEARPPLEVQLFGGEHQQLVAARPVGDATAPVATLLLALDPGLLAKWLGAAPAGSRAELIQAAGAQPVVLAAAGAAAGAQNVSQGVPGSRWQVRLSSSVPVQGTLPDSGFLTLFGAAAGVLFVLGAAGFLFGARLIRTDLVRFLRHFIEIYSGSRPDAGRLRLREFRRAAGALDQYLQIHHDQKSDPGTSAIGRPHRAVGSESVPDMAFFDEDKGEKKTSAES